MKKTMLFLLSAFSAITILCSAANTSQPEFSTAGFYEMPGMNRTVYTLNPAWRFFKGDVAGAYKSDFDDSKWGVVSLPHGVEYLPTEASGCINYQGPVWYRKHMQVTPEMCTGKAFLYFEAVMGKCKIYINGEQAGEHFGGYLPIVIDAGKYLKPNRDNVIAVWADNSDDPDYPPGKAQNVLDYTYFGGIYRDAYLITHGKVHLTDANFEGIIAGGGVIAVPQNVSETSADVLVKAHVRNESDNDFHGKVRLTLNAPDGRRASSADAPLTLAANAAETVSATCKLTEPALWSPATPNLYNLIVEVVDASGKVIDGYRKKIGVRSIEMRGSEGGFYLNGKPYGKPVVGVNRHQDFAVLGNAVPNSLHWRDAKKLRDAGVEVIRNAHCPQDPAFMDACDQFGLLVIENTPGWQFWSRKDIFRQRVISDIRNMVRRDRDRACLWFWEPILNETGFPADFATEASQTLKEEYPFDGENLAACDQRSQGSQNFDILFNHPSARDMKDASPVNSKKSYFTREWGDHVDDWSSHNSPSRVFAGWGEVPQLVQAQHYASPIGYNVTCYDMLYKLQAHFIGGALWHSFDHQRGYHPDPFYGGLMDIFRQPKYSYYMFMAQRPLSQGAMIYIAHEMTPFSPADVTVYSNCDEVRLTFNRKTYTYVKDKTRVGMPSPIITFKDVYSFNAAKGNGAALVAQGLVNGQVVATHTVRMSKRPSKLQLGFDWQNVNMVADGSDCMTVVAYVTDQSGNIKRLNHSTIKFEVEGEGVIVGDASIGANPKTVSWGNAPVLIRSTLTPGKIRVKASMLHPGSQVPVSGSVEFESVPTKSHLLYQKSESAYLNTYTGNASVNGDGKTLSNTELLEEIEKLRQEVQTLKLKEVERDQAAFGEANK